MPYVVKEDLQEVAVKVVSQLQYVELEPGLCVFRLTRSSGAEPLSPAQGVRFSAVMGEVSEEGFASTKAVRAFLKGKPMPREQVLHLVAPAFRQILQQEGFAAAQDASAKANDGWQFVRYPFKALVEEGACLDDVLRLDFSSNMAFDRHGEVLPVAKRMDYIEAGLHNRNYDLDKAVAILKEDPRIVFLDDRNKVLEEGESPILDIPYYNRDDGRSQFLALLFRPTAEDEKRLWAAQQAYRTKYPSTMWRQAIRDLDMLGLAAKGAVRPDQESE